MIEKEDVKKELEAFADTLTVIGGSYIRSAIRLAIEPMKEIEAVPVIRCKDCNNAHYDTIFKEYWCNGKKVKFNHFCGYAERRQDG